jgi:ABC-type sugar transport system ATPase subunit
MDGIEIRSLKKWYGDTHALDGMDLVARPGEILGIAGPNGSGKSTLIKILAGETLADHGEIHIDGEPWSPASAARKVAVVHQEPQGYPNLTVGENLMVGREGNLVGRPKPGGRELALLRRLGIDRYVDAPLGSCILAVQQRVEIAHALIREARCILFDEPNSALTDEESRALFSVMESLAQSGHVVLLVSHRLAELVAHTRRVAVIRDGRCAAILEGERLTQEGIAEELVVGQARRTVTRSDRVQARQSCLVLEGWTHRRAFAEVGLRVDAGEIVALVGVEGSGARELLQSLAGFERARGRVSIGDLSGEAAVRTASAYVAPDRRASLFGNLSLGENIVSRLGRPQIARMWGALERRKSQNLARRFIGQFAIKSQSATQLIGSLSGGNQQKAAIAAAIIARPRLLLMEEPTRGVDIGSKGEIYHILREYATSGNAVLIYCTEVPEVFEAADRVHVIVDGRLSPSLSVGTFSDVEALAKEITSLQRRGPKARIA